VHPPQRPELGVCHHGAQPFRGLELGEGRGHGGLGCAGADVGGRFAVGDTRLLARLGVGEVVGEATRLRLGAAPTQQLVDGVGQLGLEGLLITICRRSCGSVTGRTLGSALRRTRAGTTGARRTVTCHARPVRPTTPVATRRPCTSVEVSVRRPRARLRARPGRRCHQRRHAPHSFLPHGY
jgi:hypothetical protein